MPTELELDDTPFGESVDIPDDNSAVNMVDDDGKIPCPTCGDKFMPGGIKRHMTVKHGDSSGYTPNSGGTVAKKGSRGGGISIASAGMQFQQGAAPLVSMACKDCASVLYHDAQKDWIAIDQFCMGRPKLRKQVQDMLTYSDFLMLISVFGSTAQRMVSHHSLGKSLQFGIDITGPSNPEHGGHDPMANMAAFMQAMPEAERNALINDALNSMAANGG